MDKFPDLKWVEDTIGDHLDLTIKTDKIDMDDLSKGKTLLVVKVGTDDRPASEQDIENVQKSLLQILPKGSFCVVTHHAIDFQSVPIGTDFIKEFMEHMGETR